MPLWLFEHASGSFDIASLIFLVPQQHRHRRWQTPLTRIMTTDSVHIEATVIWNRLVGVAFNDIHLYSPHGPGVRRLC